MKEPASLRNNKRFYTVKETSKILGVSTNTIYTYLDKGTLTGRRLNNRGRFKIPFSQIEPYLEKETYVKPTIIQTKALTQQNYKSNKSTGTMAIVSSIVFGVVVFFVFTNFNVGSYDLLKDTLKSITGYSERTLNTFDHVVGSVIKTNSTVAQKDTSEQSEVLSMSTGLEDWTLQDNDLKIETKVSETKSKINELYVNSQLLYSTSQKLLWKNKTLTSSELSENIKDMQLLLGEPSDLPGYKSVFGQINWLSDDWNIDLANDVKRSAAEVSNVLNLLETENLTAFSNPNLGDVNALVEATNRLQKEIGSETDLGASSLFSKVKVIEDILKGIDSTQSQIAEMLTKWDSLNETDKLIISNKLVFDTLKINNIFNVQDIVFDDDSTSDKITQKNTLLTLYASLEANKVFFSQKRGQPIKYSWLEENPVRIKTLLYNPSNVEQEAIVDYSLPNNLKSEDVINIQEGLKLKDSEGKLQIYGNISLGKNETKLFTVQVNDVWHISEDLIESRKKLFADVLSNFQLSSNSQKVETLKSDIDNSINVLGASITSSLTPEDKIRKYDEINFQVEDVDTKIHLLKNLGGEEKVLGAFSGKPHNIIYIVVVLAVLVVFFLIGYFRKRTLFKKSSNSDTKLTTKKFNGFGIIVFAGLLSGVLSATFMTILLINLKEKPVQASQVEVLGESVENDTNVPASEAYQKVYIEVPEGTRINVRKNADPGSSIVSKIESSKYMNLVDHNGDWVLIADDAGNELGYVSSQFVKDENYQIDLNTQNIVDTFDKGNSIEILPTSTGWLRVRNAPNGNEVGKVNPGEVYTVLDKVGNWVKIDLQNSEDGWVSAYYVRFE